MQVVDEEKQKRLDAVHVMQQHPNDIKAAVEAYKQLHKDANTRNLSDYLKRWHKHMNEHGHVWDIKASGRPPIVSDKEAMEASYAFAVDSYEKLEESVEQVPIVKKLLARQGVTARMLVRRMEQLNPEVAKCHTPEIKKELTAKEKKERLEIAKEWLQKDDIWFNRIIWMDCKSVWIKRLGAKPRKVWGLRRHPIYANLIKKKKLYTRSGVHLKWYSGVCGKVGGVLLVYVTGTTHKPTGGEYWVSFQLLPFIKPAPSVATPIMALLCGLSRPCAALD